jgi:serine/threonine-protein kinase
VKGTPFGRYELIELLGRGGMGEVWKAFDTGTQRVVAVKVLPAQLAADPVFEQRFRREAYAAAGLNDPHVVPIHNFGEIEHRLYVDMRLIDGQDLEHVLAHGPLDPERAVKIIEQVASALNAAHRVGLVHRDVKPSNILLAEDDFSYLIDFGIARGTAETGLTATGNVVGTWPYMAPERFTAGQNDTRSDTYALACVLYECLTASPPFPGDSVEQQIAGHLTTPPPRPSVTRPGVSPQLDSVIATGMAKDPDQRYRTTTELARAARSAISSAVPRPAALRDPQGTVPTLAGTPEKVDEASAPTQARPQQDVDEAWAPTQARPAEGLREAQAPNGDAPDERSGTEPAPWPWWQRKATMIPAAAALIVVGLVTILFAVNGNEPPARPNGPLDGTFAVEFGAPTTPNGQPYGNAPGGSETWVIESACRSGACVATASKVSGSQSTASTLVLDEIDGKWTSVSAAPGTCQNAPTEFWDTMSLQSQPDGSLHGEFIVRSTTDCARNQEVTSTRSGDVERNVPIADPQAQPPRVASPAEGLHGRYQETDSYADGGRSAEANFDIETYCLRTGQRCLSYWSNPDDAKILVFSQSQWVLAPTSSDSKCHSGGAAHREITLQYPLPQPPHNPITLLSGRGHYTLAGACPFNSDFDSRVERTGN